MVPGGFLWLFMALGWFFMVPGQFLWFQGGFLLFQVGFHGSWSGFHDFRSIIIAINGSRLVFHNSR